MKIFDHTIEKEEKLYFNIPIGQLVFGSEIEIPVIIVSGYEEGPVLWLNGTVHGDELNGSYAAWELAREIDVKKLKGKIIVTPVANPMALSDRNKISYVDFIDMDTVFPGEPDGLLAQRSAYILYKEIRKSATHLISFHTMATPYKAVPYTVRKIVSGANKETNTLSEELQRAFGIKVNCAVDLTGPTNELPGVTSGALDITCIQDGIPAIMVELGQGGKIEERYVHMAKKGIMNVMSYLKMIEAQNQFEKERILITKRKYIRSDCGGIARVFATPGQQVENNDIIAEFHYYGEKTKTQVAEENLFIIGARENPVVHTGDRLAFVGTEWKEW